MEVSINQTILGNGHYRLDSPIIYYSKRYKKMVTVTKGEISDGATGTFDVVSHSWWVHDKLCKTGKWDDDTKISNWQCSQVLQDILTEEGRKWQGRRWFWMTWLFGGGKARKNGMF